MLSSISDYFQRPVDTTGSDQGQEHGASTVGPVHADRIVRIVQISLIAVGTALSACASAYPVILKTAVERPASFEADSTSLVERHTLFLLGAPLAPEGRWPFLAGGHDSPTSADAPASMDRDRDCRQWNDEGVYRLLIDLRSRRGTPRHALPYFDRARLLCPDDERINANYRIAFALGDRARVEGP